MKRKDPILFDRRHLTKINVCSNKNHFLDPALCAILFLININILFMRTIVAPTDFSSVSINALNYAADLAAAIEADLILLHVVQIPITVS